MNNNIFHVSTEGGIPELYNYAKILIILIVFCIFYHRTGQAVYMAAALITLILLSDDSMQVHERAGESIDAVTDGTIFGFRAQETGDRKSACRERVCQYV